MWNYLLKKDLKILFLKFYGLNLKKIYLDQKFYFLAKLCDIQK